MNCKICYEQSQKQFAARVLGKHEVSFFVCPACGFGQTEDPTWLAEAYEHPIHPADVGLVARNQNLCKVLTVLLRLFFNGSGKFLDHGAGTGLLVRLMRDQGFDFRWADKYATNLFAQGLEHQSGARYEALTAFEVFEHLVSPREEIREMAALADHIFFSTELLPSPTPGPQGWAYYSLITGQHVAFHTARSLSLLASSAGMTHQCVSGSLHLFSRRPPPAAMMRLFAHPKITRLLMPFCHRPSLLPQDYESMAATLAAQQVLPPSDS